jgi:hypothetical protein
MPRCLTRAAVGGAARVRPCALTWKSYQLLMPQGFFQVVNDLQFCLFYRAFKMRLIMSQWLHGETTTNRQSIGGESAESRCPYHRTGTTARRASGTAPGLGSGNPRANGGHPWRGSGHRPTTAAALAPVGTVHQDDPGPMGRPA